MTCDRCEVSRELRFDAEQKTRDMQLERDARAQRAERLQESVYAAVEIERAARARMLSAEQRAEQAEQELLKYKPNPADDIGQCRRCGLTVSKWELEGSPHMLHDACLFLGQKEQAEQRAAALEDLASAFEKIEHRPCDYSCIHSDCEAARALKRYRALAASGGAAPAEQAEGE